MTLDDIIEEFVEDERPEGIMISDDVPLAQLIRATKYYCGYADIASRIVDLDCDPVPPVPAIDGLLDLNCSERAVIEPLFKLYVDYEAALNIEASVDMGIEVFGVTSSEIGTNIRDYEQHFLPKTAFNYDIILI